MGGGPKPGRGVTRYGLPAGRGEAEGGGAHPPLGPLEDGAERDVVGVLRAVAARRRDRVDTAERALHRQVLVDADLLSELAAQRVEERLAPVHAAAGEQPTVGAGLLVAAQEDPVLPAQ